MSRIECVADLFYGTDYNSHLGTRRGGMATYNASDRTFTRSIHNLESSYFRTKFEPTLSRFAGATSGIGVISDTDAQPLVLNSHLGRFAIVTVAKIQNMNELEQHLLGQNMHFTELSSGKTNQTELVALLIIQGKTFEDGIDNVFRHIKGSCSMLLLTEDGIIAARDSWGRTPIVIGKKDGAYAATSESTAFPNLDYVTDRYLGPGEVVRLRADGIEQLRAPREQMQICSFLWVYYGFPTSTYEGRNVEEMRYDNGCMMAAIVRGTQLRDNVGVLFDDGAREVHMRIACPPLIYGCPYIGFTSSKSDMELITRRIIGDFEGDPNKDLALYATTDSPQYKRMVEEIRKRLGLTSLRFNKLETLVKAIGLPKCKLCTHCFDGTGCCGH